MRRLPHAILIYPRRASKWELPLLAVKIYLPKIDDATRLVDTARTAAGFARATFELCKS